MSQVLEGLGIPPEVAAGLARLRDDLQKAAGDNLVCLALYGGLARKRYHVGRSDVNLFLLLRDASISILQKLAPVLHQAWRSFRVETLLITPEELEPAAHDFPTKFLDIKNHHVLLSGRDVLSSLSISSENLRDRLQQELRNMKMRLRRRFLAISQSAGEQARVLQDAARSLAVELGTLLHLKGHPVPEDYATASIFAAAARAFDLNGDALSKLASLRNEARAPEDATALFGQVLETINRALSISQQG